MSRSQPTRRVPCTEAGCTRSVAVYVDVYGSPIDAYFAKCTACLREAELRLLAKMEQCGREMEK